MSTSHSSRKKLADFFLADNGIMVYLIGDYVYFAGIMALNWAVKLERLN